MQMVIISTKYQVLTLKLNHYLEKQLVKNTEYALNLQNFMKTLKLYTIQELFTFRLTH